MEDSEILDIQADITKAAAQALLKRNEELLAENRQLKKQLAETKTISDNYWSHIVWLRTPEDLRPTPKPCAFCKSKNVSLDGSVCSREFFVWCDDCEAMGPEAGSEAAAIEAWNKAGDPELQEG